MRKELFYFIAILGVSLISIYFILTKGFFVAAIFISGIFIGVFNSFIRVYGNTAFLLTKSIGAAKFIMLYLFRILIPVLLCVGIMRIDGVLCVVFLMGFSAQFFSIGSNKKWINYS